LYRGSLLVPWRWIRSDRSLVARRWTSTPIRGHLLSRSELQALPYAPVARAPSSDPNSFSPLRIAFTAKRPAILFRRVKYTFCSATAKASTARTELAPDISRRRNSTLKKQRQPATIGLSSPSTNHSRRTRSRYGWPLKRLSQTLQ